MSNHFFAELRESSSGKDSLISYPSENSLRRPQVQWGSWNKRLEEGILVFLFHLTDLIF